MMHRIFKGNTVLAASALAGMLLTGCNNSEPVANRPQPVAGNESGTGTLPKPTTPTAEEIKAMEALYSKPKDAVTLPEGIAAPAALAKSAADAVVGFNDYGSLAQIKDHAYASVTNAYFQWVTNNAYAVVVPMEYGHYHLDYEIATDCFSGTNGLLSPGRYGTLVAGRCIDKGDAASRPRFLGPHDGVQTIQFYIYDRIKLRQFDLKSFYLRPVSDLAQGHVQIWINKVGVGWQYWADLASSKTGMTWNMPYANAITEVRIVSPSHAVGYGWAMDNITIGNILN